MFQDKELVCRECGGTFTFTASEQEFYEAKGFTNEPSRCPECRRSRRQEKSRREGSSYNRGPRQMYQAVCARCGRPCEVPFNPTAGRPVYCNDCYQPRERY